MVKEETIDPAHVEPVRSSLIKPIAKTTPKFNAKNRQRTPLAEEAIIFGQPESYWKKILRPSVCFRHENPNENPDPEHEALH